jgi:hypothetical protein
MNSVLHRTVAANDGAENRVDGVARGQHITGEAEHCHPWTVTTVLRHKGLVGAVGPRWFLVERCWQLLRVESDLGKNGLMGKAVRNEELRAFLAPVRFGLVAETRYVCRDLRVR